jgi:hypothetical protein
MLSESYSKTQDEKPETGEVIENNEFDANGVESGEEDNNPSLPDVTANSAPAIPVFSGIPKMPVFTPPMPVFNAPKSMSVMGGEKEKIEIQLQNEEIMPIVENTENDTKQKKVNLFIWTVHYFFFIFKSDRHFSILICILSGLNDLFVLSLHFPPSFSPFFLLFSQFSSMKIVSKNVSKDLIFSREEKEEEKKKRKLILIDYTEEEKLAVMNNDYGNVKEEEKGSENSKISSSQSLEKKIEKIEKIEKESAEDLRKKKLKEIVDQIPTKK